MITKLVSGGQTGADRAAMDIALEWPLEFSGWVPKGFLDENGKIPPKYKHLREADDANPNTRTRLNVRDSDGTLLLWRGKLAGGSLITSQAATELGKPLIPINLNDVYIADAVQKIKKWIEENSIHTLNVAGPRESEDRGIYSATRTVLADILAPFPPPDETELALKIQSEVLANFRHWDVIRWGVPTWFLSATGALSSYISKVPPTEHDSVRAMSLILAGLGAVCLWLERNLIRYHNLEIDKFESGLQVLSIPPKTRDLLRLRLPFKLQGWGLVETATFWFIAATALVTGWLVYIFFR